jgi:hypothetical protein
MDFVYNVSRIGSQLPPALRFGRLSGFHLVVVRREPYENCNVNQVFANNNWVVSARKKKKKKKKINLSTFL